MAVVYPEPLHRIHSLAVAVKSIIPFGRCPIHRNEPYFPFFIIGSGRSGNTLLRRILASHPSYHIPPETYVLGAITKKYWTVAHMDWNDIVPFIYSFFQFHDEFETFGVENLAELVRTVRRLEEPRRSLALIINAFYEWHAQQHGISFERWGDKTPLNVYVLKRLHNVFPKAQFIHIVRDGGDVVASYLEAGIYQSAEEAAWRWRRAVGLCRRFGKANARSYLEVRYEDLVTEPRHTVSRICAFLGTPFDERMLDPPGDAAWLGDVPRRERHREVFKPISADKIGKGRKALSAEQKRLVSAIIARQLVEFGYADLRGS
jgi:protein-tyrosine sulfotransferase